MGVFISRVYLTGDNAVKIQTAFHRGRGTLLSLSECGVYIVTDMSILPRATVRLQLKLPDAEHWVEAEALVHWDNHEPQPKDGFPAGYGMHLTRIPPETAYAIREVMQSAIIPPSPIPEPEGDGESSFTLAPGSLTAETKDR